MCGNTSEATPEGGFTFEQPQNPAAPAPWLHASENKWSSKQNYKKQTKKKASWGCCIQQQSFVQFFKAEMHLFTFHLC